MDKMLSDKVDTLTRISGLRVAGRVEKNEHVFDFIHDGICQTIKTCFTYPKAKLFAEGVSFGRTIENN